MKHLLSVTDIQNDILSIIKLADKLKVNVDFAKLLKIAALIHDIGRFEQATWNNSFSDKCYEEMGNSAIKNHSHAGYHILLDEHEMDNFDIPFQYQYATLAVVNHHSDNILHYESKSLRACFFLTFRIFNIIL